MLDFAQAAHVVHGDSATGTVRQVTAGAVHVVRDLLTYGPCDVDPARHVELRLAHWGLPSERAPDFTLSATVRRLDAEQPIVLWATRAWSDQLFLWWSLDALAREHVEPARLWLAAPVTYRPLAATGAAPPAELARALADARPITADAVDPARELWRRFASASPLPFDELRQTGSPAVADLASIAEPHGWWFPRWIDGSLQLSQMDELLLHVFDDEWRGPEALLRSARTDDLTDRFMNVFGDRLVIARLQQWVANGCLQYERRDAVGWAEHAYRLTAEGHRVLDEGLPSVAAAPPIYTGGCRTHDPATPFVRVVDSSGWRLSLS